MALAALLSAFQALRVESVSSEWADEVWEQDFMDTVPLEGWLEEEVLARGVDAFDQLHLRLENVARAHEGAESIWSFLSEKRISHQNLIAILHHFVNSGQKLSSSFQQRILAVKAACLYFLLLEIPGSLAHKVFHPVLFDKCVLVARKVLPETSPGKRKLKNAPLKGSQAATGRGRKAKQPRLEEEVHDALENEDDDETEEMALTGQNVERLHEAVCVLLQTLHYLLSVFSLKENPQCVGHCIQVLVELTKQNSQSQKIDFTLTVRESRTHSVAELAYCNLKALCTTSHGSKDEILRSIFHRLLNHILMVGGEARANLVLASTTQHAVNVKYQTLQFVSHLVKEDGEQCIPVLRILLQHICVKVPDKADYRSHAAQAVCTLLACMNSSAYAEFIEWLYKYSQNAKVGYRVFALDVISELLDCPEREADSTVCAERLGFFSHKFLVQSTVRRCCDRMSTVRAKALSTLAKILNQQHFTTLQHMHVIVQGGTHLSNICTAPCAVQSSITDNSHGNITSTDTPVCVEETPSNIHTVKIVEITDLGIDTLPDGKEVLSMLRERAADGKPGVRKCALQVLEGLMQHNILPVTDVDLACLVERCRDLALSVRKQALLSLTNLLKSHPEDATLLRAWLKGLLPAVTDRETSVQEKVLECIDEIILKNIKEPKRGSDEPSQKCVWNILDMLVIPEHQQLCSYLGKACHMLAVKNPFSVSFINALLSHVESEHAPAAWLLLSKVAGHCPKIDCNKILACWDQVHRNSDMPSIMCHMLAVIGTMAKYISNDACHRLIENLVERLRSFDSPLEVITACISTLDQLCRAQESLDSAMMKVSKWCKELIEACDVYISRVVLTETGRAGMNEDKVVCYVFTLGEVAQLSPSNINKRIFLLVQSLLASPNLEQGEPAGECQEAAVPSSQPILLSQPLLQFRGSSMPTVVRAHAFITLGKLCLQNEDLAKKCIAALARELEISPDISIRNNVIIIMCDLCIRYTTLVDCYISKISVCLRDEEPFIRRQTLILLTNLLQEDYVKWRGFLFHRFACVLVDSDPGIRSFAEFCLIHLLLKKHPVIIFQHFIECIFHFNCYEKHEKYQFTQTKREQHLFSLKGSQNRSKRMTIYRLFLEHLTDEQRFNLTTKLAQNILGSFVDGMLTLDMEAADLISDIFSVLCCKEIKLVVSRARPADEDLPEDGEMAMATAVVQVAQKKLISQVQKKNFVENIIPTVILLKKQMEAKRMPVLKNLMLYLREVMKDYRDEVKDVLAADRQLAAEVEYDLKKYEEDEQERRRLSGDVSAAANGPGSPRAHSPTNAPAAPDNHSPHEGKDGAAETSNRNSLGGESSKPHECNGIELPPSTNKTRSLSLSTVAIVSSAKKLVEAQRKGHNQSMKCIRPTSPPSNFKPVSPQNQMTKHTSCESRVPEESSCRAISTPDHTINEMTFADVDLSAITSVVPGASKSQEVTAQPQKDILCIMSPDTPPPLIRPWNLSSPTGKSKKPLQPRRNPAAQKFPLSP